MMWRNLNTFSYPSINSQKERNNYKSLQHYITATNCTTNRPNPIFQCCNYP
uniref:Uncharacterized protein n=1 Tax=Arundo donax TaxID=35708 RepID=A0A0A9C190_ARUDO